MKLIIDRQMDGQINNGQQNIQKTDLDQLQMV